MDLYKLLSKNYDALFPVAKPEVEFLDKAFTGKRRILDIGCGTGSKTVLFAANRRIVAIDDSQDMIDVANKLHPNQNVRYVKMSMFDMTGQFAPISFDGIACVGNTMAHLDEPEDLVEMLRQVWDLLEPGGVFVGQIINFDRIITQNVQSLPVIETDDLIFRRSYVWHGASMRFRIELEDKKTGQAAESSSPMRPIIKSALESALIAAGFNQTGFFGSFAGEPYDHDSYHLIFTTEKTSF